MIQVRPRLFSDEQNRTFSNTSPDFSFLAFPGFVYIPRYFFNFFIPPLCGVAARGRGADGGGGSKPGPGADGDHAAAPPAAVQPHRGDGAEPTRRPGVGPLWTPSRRGGAATSATWAGTLLSILMQFIIINAMYHFNIAQYSAYLFCSSIYYLFVLIVIFFSEIISKFLKPNKEFSLVRANRQIRQPPPIPSGTPSPPSPFPLPLPRRRTT